MWAATTPIADIEGRRIGYEKRFFGRRHTGTCPGRCHLHHLADLTDIWPVIAP
ncbi:MAG: hypothetical protein H6668_12620 [Ardenticatenaceae bacterium]|nr:hypothetical protein [Ardenticatenaceae bacterium]